MRLDKFLSETTTESRSQVKREIRQGMVTVNGIVEKLPEKQIEEKTDCVCLKGKELHYQPFVYFMLNKPAGVVSATEDTLSKTVVELLNREDYRKDIFPAGRLDKDTEGFLLLTNDGELAHRLLSPKKHVDKTYFVRLRDALSEEAGTKLETGVSIGEKKDTRPAKVERVDTDTILLTIQEGKLHQVKRMLQAVDNQVLFLKRITFGGLSLDEGLSPGEYRALSDEEVKLLYDA